MTKCECGKPDCKAQKMYDLMDRHAQELTDIIIELGLHSMGPDAVIVALQSYANDVAKEAYHTIRQKAEVSEGEKIFKELRQDNNKVKQLVDKVVREVCGPLDEVIP